MPISSASEQECRRTAWKPLSHGCKTGTSCPTRAADTSRLPRSHARDRVYAKATSCAGRRSSWTRSPSGGRARLAGTQRSKDAGTSTEVATVPDRFEPLRGFMQAVWSGQLGNRGRWVRSSSFQLVGNADGMPPRSPQTWARQGGWWNEEDLTPVTQKHFGAGWHGEHLDVTREAAAGVRERRQGGAVDAFDLEGGEERFRLRDVPADAGASHRLAYLVPSADTSERTRGVLTRLNRSSQHWFVDLIVNTRSALLPVSSSRGSCGVCC